MFVRSVWSLFTLTHAHVSTWCWHYTTSIHYYIIMYDQQTDEKHTSSSSNNVWWASMHTSLLVHYWCATTAQMHCAYNMHVLWTWLQVFLLSSCITIRLSTVDLTTDHRCHRKHGSKCSWIRSPISNGPTWSTVSQWFLYTFVGTCVYKCWSMMAINIKHVV